MDYESMTVAQLKDLLKERGLKVSGKKSELIERLSDAGTSPKPVSDEAQNTEEAVGIEEPETIDDEDFDEEFFDEDWDDEDGEYVTRQKPVLDDETKAALLTRKSQRSSMPKFRRQEWFRYFRLARTGWRKPKGYQSKQRLNMKYRTPMVRIGHRKIASVRGLHPSGFEEVLVNTLSELDGLDPERQAVRIGSKVGNRKRSVMHDRADQLGLRVLNRRRIQRKGDMR
ncbi:MAG: 50S ribosomal protein L32e [Candidatus Thermoplasmatota archaeon]|nr:50S ribosomal protein L32e [Candidatus Thermoplasmatota archaeon]